MSLWSDLLGGAQVLTTSSGHSVTITTTAAGSGKIVVIAGGAGNPTSAPTCTDNHGNTYTSGVFQSASGHWIGAWYLDGSIASGTVITVTQSGNSTAWPVAVYSSANLASGAPNVAASQSKATGSQPNLSFTPTVADVQLIGAVHVAGTETFTADTSNGWASLGYASGSSHAIFTEEQLDASTALNHVAPTMNDVLAGETVLAIGWQNTNVALSLLPGHVASGANVHGVEMTLPEPGSGTSPWTDILGGAQATSAAASSTHAVTTSAAASGKLVCFFGGQSGPTAVSVADSQGNTWTAGPSQLNNGRWNAAFYLDGSIPSGTVITCTVTGATPTDWVAAAFESTVALASGAPDVSVGTADTAGEPPVADFTTTVANESLIGCTVFAGPETFTADSGWAEAAYASNASLRAIYVEGTVQASAAVGSYRPTPNNVGNSSTSVILGWGAAATSLTLAVGHVSTGAAAHGVTLTPAPVSLAVGHVATGAAAHGVTLTPSPVALAVGHVSSGATAHGTNLAGSGAASLAAGHVVSGAAAHGVALSFGAAPLPVGHIASGAAAHGTNLAGSGAATLAVNEVASGAAARGVTLTPSPIALAVGHVSAGTTVRGVTLVEATVLAVGHVASAAAVRGVLVTDAEGGSSVSPWVGLLGGVQVATVTSTTFAVTTTAAASGKLVAFFGGQGQPTGATCADNQGNTWTALTHEFSNGRWVAAFYLDGSIPLGTVITCTAAGATPTDWLGSAFKSTTGLASGAPDVNTGVIDSAGQQPLLQFSTSAVNEALIGVSVVAGGETFTADEGWAQAGYAANGTLRAMYVEGTTQASAGVGIYRPPMNNTAKAVSSVVLGWPPLAPQALAVGFVPGPGTNHPGVDLGIPFSVPVGHVASGAAVRGANLTPSPIALPVGKVPSGQVTHGANLAGAGAVALAVSHVASGAQVFGADVLSDTGRLFVGHVASSEATRGATISGTGSVVLGLGHIPTSAAARGADVVASGAVSLPVGAVPGDAAVRGVQLTPAPSALAVGRITSGAAVKGANLTPSPVSIEAGKVSSGSVARGANLAPSGAAALALGAIAASTTVYGADVLSDTGRLFIGYVASSAAAHGSNLSGAGAATLALGMVAATSAVRGTNLSGSGAVPLPVGPAPSGAIVRGADLAAGAVALSLGHVASSGAVRGADLAVGVLLALGAVPSGSAVRGVTFAPGAAPFLLGAIAAASAARGADLAGAGTAYLDTGHVPTAEAVFGALITTLGHPGTATLSLAVATALLTATTATATLEANT